MKQLNNPHCMWQLVAYVLDADYSTHRPYNAMLLRELGKMVRENMEIVGQMEATGDYLKVLGARLTKMRNEAEEIVNPDTVAWILEVWEGLMFAPAKLDYFRMEYIRDLLELPVSSGRYPQTFKACSDAMRQYVEGRVRELQSA